MIRVGVAGWDYEDWKGVVYPSPAPRGFDPLAWLSGFFPLVEVNSTFYRPAAPRTVRSWLSRVEGRLDFRFSAKVWRRLTHERAPLSAADVRAAREGLDLLAGDGRLAAALLQFPWSFKRDPESRAWLREVTRALRGLPLVLEVRHASWNVPELYASLAAEGIGFVNLDQPLFRNSLGPSAVATAPVAYVRIHGRNAADWFRADATRDERYDYLYAPEELSPWVDRVRAVAAAPGVAEVVVVTNNHFGGQEVVNALQLRSMIERRRVEGPATLWERFAAALDPFADPVTSPSSSPSSPPPAPPDASPS
ncbi:MAG TPA: DUF72 domain-containing protein [Anaeromyxobacteraceae bacterium]|nr:DUF72 domain-containing protein [Anaeromyxobacteraceae bacterium]